MSSQAQGHAGNMEGSDKGEAPLRPNQNGTFSIRQEYYCVECDTVRQDWLPCVRCSVVS